MTDPRAMEGVYRETVVVVWDPRDPQRAHDPARVAVARAEQAVVLTAWNPGHLRPTRAANEQANVRLAAVLAAFGLTVWPADGRNPEGTFHEPGFCVWGLGTDAGLVVARDFGQAAIYVYRPTGDRVIAWTADGVITPG